MLPALSPSNGALSPLFFMLMSLEQVPDELARILDDSKDNGAKGIAGQGLERLVALAMSPSLSIPGGGRNRAGSSPPCLGQRGDGADVDTSGLDARQEGAAVGDGAKGGLMDRCTSGHHPDERPASLDRLLYRQKYRLEERPASLNRLMYRQRTPSPRNMREDFADEPAVADRDSPSASSLTTQGGSSLACPRGEGSPAHLSRLMPRHCTPSPCWTAEDSPDEHAVPREESPPASTFRVEGSPFAQGGIVGVREIGSTPLDLIRMNQVSLLLKYI